MKPRYVPGHELARFYANPRVTVREIVIAACWGIAIGLLAAYLGALLP